MDFVAKRERLPRLQTSLSDQAIRQCHPIQNNHTPNISFSMTTLLNVVNAISNTPLAYNKTSLLEQICVEIYDSNARRRPNEIDIILVDLKQHLFTVYSKSLSASLDVRQKMRELSFEHCKTELENICSNILLSNFGHSTLSDKVYLRALFNLCLFKRATVLFHRRRRRIDPQGRSQACEMTRWSMNDDFAALEFKSFKRPQQRYEIQFPVTQAWCIIGYCIKLYLPTPTRVEGGRGKSSDFAKKRRIE